MAHVFGNALYAREGSFFKAEQENAVQKHLRNLTADGKVKLGESNIAGMIEGRVKPNAATVDVLPEVLAQSARFGTGTKYQPTTTVVPHKVSLNLNAYKNAASKSPGEAMRLGTAVSLGRGRFTCEQVSIWDVARGKEMAQTPVEVSKAALRRQRIIQKAALEAANSKAVAGWRLFPELTAGRALGWGTVLAFWGTATVTSVACRGLGIQDIKDVGPVFRSWMAQPTAHVRKQYLEPMSSTLAIKGEAMQGPGGLAGALKQRLNN